MAPAVGYSKPAIIMRVVVLPEALGPSKVRNSPRAMSTLMSSTALARPSYDLTTLRSRRYGTLTPRDDARGSRRGDDQRVDDDTALPGRAHDDRIEVDLRDVRAVGVGVVSERLQAPRETLHVGGRTPAPGLEQRGAADLAHHGGGIALAQRQGAQGEVFQDLDGDAPQAEGENVAELGIAAHSGEDLHSPGHHLLHEEAGHP